MSTTTTDTQPTATHRFWTVAIADIMLRDAKPEEAAENMFKRVEEIFANNEILQG